MNNDKNYGKLENKTLLSKKVVIKDNKQVIDFYRG